MNPIGGYFELELRHGEHYHQGALRLNTARNCLEYVLRSRHYKKIYMPYYTCEVMLEPLAKCNVEYEFYHIDANLEPADDIELDDNEAFLYTNYFGLKQRCVESLSEKYGSKLVVDNAQAFFAEPLAGIDTFYSARKFFGVADGAYLYTDAKLNAEFEQDQSYGRMSHLLKRADVGPEFGYQDFRNNDDSLINNPIRRMSNLTEKILCSVDYDYCKKKRVENYKYLDGHLCRSNKIHFELADDDVPMVYPYMTEDMNLRKKLIDNKIFVATYWPNVKCETGFSNEKLFSDSIIPLPTDQRYNSKDMHEVINLFL